MSEKQPTKNQPLWKSNIDSGYFQMLSIYGGEEKEEAKKLEENLAKEKEEGIKEEKDLMKRSLAEMRLKVLKNKY